MPFTVTEVSVLPEFGIKDIMTKSDPVYEMVAEQVEGGWGQVLKYNVTC